MGQRIAVFPGSFDPVTLGHEEIVLRALKLFDEIIIGVGTNSQKQPLFTVDKRIALLNAVFKQFHNITIQTYEGLTIDFCKQVGADFILRGLRSAPDFEYEKNIAQLNYSMANIETVLITGAPANSHISSTIVREIIKNNGNAKPFVPEAIRSYL